MKYILYTVSFLIIFTRCQAIPIISDDDTLHVYPMKDVVVTATRTTIFSKDSPSPVQLIAQQEIERTNGNSLADLLRTSGSVFIKDRGPISSLKTISLRGMASEHILVLLDGTRLNNFQNGLVDFSLLPIQNVDHIEVVRGGNSALYGADALGGVIQIVSSQPTEDFQVRANTSIGSFDFRRYSIETSAKILNFGLVAGASHDRSAGDYPFVLHRPGLPDTTQLRKGADFKRTQIYLKSRYNYDEKSNILFSLQRVKSDQGFQGSLSYPSQGRQNDDAVSTSLSLQDSHLEKFIFNLNSGLYYNLQNITFTNLQYSYYTKSILVSVNPQMQWIVSNWDRIIAGCEYIEGSLDGMLTGILIKRIQRSIYVSNELLLQQESPHLDRFSFYQTIRYDKLSEGQTAFSPKIGINIRLLKEFDTRIRSSYGRNFRMPTFNDLYDPWLGNSALKPEHSICFDMGIETAFDNLKVHQASVEYFDIDTKERILPNVFFFPVNIMQTQSQGIEGRYDFRLSKSLLHLFTDFTYNNAIRKTGSGDSANNKQLLYIPRFVLAFGGSMRIFDVQLNITHTFTSERFIVEDESMSLPAYSLLDMNISTDFQYDGLKLNFRVEASNVFDTDYQVIKDYPMPGRTFRCTIGVQY